MPVRMAHDATAARNNEYIRLVWLIALSLTLVRAEVGGGGGG